MKYEKVKIDRVEIPEIRAGSILTDEQKAMLEASIKKYGLVQPIILREVENGKMQLVAGKNRFDEACRQGQNEVEAIVLPLTDKDSIILHLSENLARGKVNDMDIAYVLKQAVDAKITINELATLLGHSEEWIKDRLILIELPEVYQEAVRDGRFSIGHIKAALKLPTPNDIAAALDTALNLGWQVNVIENFVKNRLEQIRLIEEAKAKSISPPPIAEIRAEQLATVEQCFICNEYVDRKTITLPKICIDCRQTAEYIIQQLGKGLPAMQKIYQALQLFNVYTKASEIKSTIDAAQKVDEGTKQALDVQ